MLRPAAGFTPWQYDSATNEYSLNISGTTVAKIDSNGNIKVKGRVLKI